VFAWNNLVIFIAQLLEQLLGAYSWIVIIAALMTWIEPNPYNPIVRFLSAVTDPVFNWVREHVPVFFGGIDFAPMIVIIAIWFLRGYLIPTATRALVYGFA